MFFVFWSSNIDIILVFYITSVLCMAVSSKLLKYIVKDKVILAHMNPQPSISKNKERSIKLSVKLLLLPSVLHSNNIVDTKHKMNETTPIR